MCLMSLLVKITFRLFNRAMKPMMAVNWAFWARNCWPLVAMHGVGFIFFVNSFKLFFRYDFSYAGNFEKRKRSNSEGTGQRRSPGLNLFDNNTFLFYV